MEKFNGWVVEVRMVPTGEDDLVAACDGLAAEVCHIVFHGSRLVAQTIYDGMVDVAMQTPHRLRVLMRQQVAEYEWVQADDLNQPELRCDTVVNHERRIPDNNEARASVTDHKDQLRSYFPSLVA